MTGPSAEATASIWVAAARAPSSASGPAFCGVRFQTVRGCPAARHARALEASPRRFGELRRDIPGVTEKVLTSHLRELEADGIVFREEALEGAVRRVTYALTPLGVSLNEALAPLGDWGRKHLLGGQSTPGEALDRSR